AKLDEILDLRQGRAHFREEPTQDPTATYAVRRKPGLAREEMAQPGGIRRRQDHAGDVPAGHGCRRASLAEELSQTVAADAPFPHHVLEGLLLENVGMRVRMAADEVPLTSDVADLAHVQKRARSDAARDDEEVRLPPAPRQRLAHGYGALAAVVEGQQDVATGLGEVDGGDELGEHW